MHINYAAATQNRFETEEFLLVAERLKTDERVRPKLVADLEEALRISKTVGPSSKFGTVMVVQVATVIMMELVGPKRKPGRPAGTTKAAMAERKETK